MILWSLAALNAAFWGWVVWSAVRAAAREDRRHAAAIRAMIARRGLRARARGPAPRPGRLRRASRA